MSEEIDTKYTRDLICPYCGYAQSEPYELFLSGDDCDGVECGSCERDFDCERHVDISYSSYKINTEEG